MATTKSFDKYVARIYGGNEGRVGLLLCYSGNSFVGRIDFYAEGATIPQDYLWHINPSSVYIILQMPMSRFDTVIATVRQEHPLHLYIDVNSGVGSSTKGHGHLATTDKEPVGEEEGGP